MQDRIQFDEAAHSYALNGAPLESVTRVIGSVLRIDSRFWKEEHRLRGKYVHAITEAIDEGNWSPEDTVIPDDQDKEGIFQRCYAYRDFLSLTGFQSLLVEAKVASPALGIAGTLDRYGKITKGRYAGRYAILDIKSGLPTAGAILQLALYEVLFPYTMGMQGTQIRRTVSQEEAPSLRIILHLRPDGKCRPEYREGSQDIADALALVRVWQFMKREGLDGTTVSEVAAARYERYESMWGRWFEDMRTTEQIEAAADSGEEQTDAIPDSSGGGRAT